MEQQRPLRLGDLVDDYCPRERRITNHAIVAIVEDAIRQTRCTACESDHVYKGGKAPLRKKPPQGGKDEQAVLYEQVLANATAGPPTAPPSRDQVTPSEPVAIPPEPVAPVLVAAAPEPAPAVAEPGPVVSTPTASDAPPASEPVPEPIKDEGWSLNRRLIRASLPRIEGQSPVPRVIPEF